MTIINAKATAIFGFGTMQEDVRAIQ